MIDLDRLLNTRTGKRGRPAGSGKPDKNILYKVSRLLAANPSMTVAAAVRTIVKDPRDYNAVDRLTGKLKENPGYLRQAKHYENAVQRVLDGTRGVSWAQRWFRDRREFDIYFHASFLREADVMSDPRVQKRADELWNAYRPVPWASDAVTEALATRDRLVSYNPEPLVSRLARQEMENVEKLARQIRQLDRYSIAEFEPWAARFARQEMERIDRLTGEVRRGGPHDS